MQAMLDKGVTTRRGIMNMHLEGAQSDLPLGHPLPQSELARDHSILVPLYAQMTDEDVHHVVHTLRAEVSRQFARIGAVAERVPADL
jgi:perosamine synthetase